MLDDITCVRQCRDLGREEVCNRHGSDESLARWGGEVEAFGPRQNTPSPGRKKGRNVRVNRAERCHQQDERQIATIKVEDVCPAERRARACERSEHRKTPAGGNGMIADVQKGRPARKRGGRDETKRRGNVGE